MLIQNTSFTNDGPVLRQPDNITPYKNIGGDFKRQYDKRIKRSDRFPRRNDYFIFQLVCVFSVFSFEVVKTETVSLGVWGVGYLMFPTTAYENSIVDSLPVPLNTHEKRN